MWKLTSDWYKISPVIAYLSKECKKCKVLRLVVGKKYFTKLCYRYTDYTAKQTDGDADSHPRVKLFISM